VIELEQLKTTKQDTQAKKTDISQITLSPFNKLINNILCYL